MPKNKFNAHDINIDKIAKDIDSIQPSLITAREIVATLYESIKASLSKGVTHQQIIEKLQSHGIKMSEATLKTYLRDGKTGTRMNYQKAQVAAESFDTDN